MSPPARLRAVLFDYGLTLVRFARPVGALGRAHELLAMRLRQRGLAVTPGLLLEAHDALEERVRVHERGQALEELDIIAVHAEVYAGLGIHADPQVLDEVARVEQEAWWAGVEVVAGAPRVLATLRRQGLRIGICSNAPYRPASMRAQLEHLGLDRLIDAATFSSEVGWRKPSAHLYRAALAALGVAAAETVMVGDRVREDVVGARAAGLRAVRVRALHDDPAPGPTHPVIDTLAGLAAVLHDAHGGPPPG